MVIKIPTFDNKVRSIKLDGNAIEKIADHLIGKKLSKYRENIYDADGDGKITLKDFIHRIKNVEGVDTNIKITTTTTATTTTGSGY